MKNLSISSKQVSLISNPRELSVFTRKNTDRVENEIVIVIIHSKRFAFCSVILVVIVASIIEKLLESGIG